MGQGGSAIQQAPGEGISQQGHDANGAAALDLVDGILDSGHANGGYANIRPLLMDRQPKRIKETKALYRPPTCNPSSAN